MIPCDLDNLTRCGQAQVILMVMRRKSINPGDRRKPELLCRDHAASVLRNYDPAYYDYATRDLDR